MKRNNSAASAAAQRPRSVFRVTPIAAGCAMMLATSGVAFAQQSSADNDPNKVVVYGIRYSIESAIQAKRDSDSIIESISAEDIGKLPDTSIAESIARLPGIAAQRTAGRASQVSIRGMAPDFALTLLNGREQVSTGDSRSVEFDQFPSELVSRVDIYKTPDAHLAAQGLSGTFNMQTARPLNYGKRTIAVNYRDQQTGIGTLAEGDGYRFSASYIDQFANRTIGIALGFARLDETGPVTSRFDNWGGGSTTYNNQTVNVPYNGFGWFADQTTQTRDGAMAVIQFKPSKTFESTIDLYYSKFDKVKATKGLQAPLNDSWAGGDYDAGGVLSNATLSGNNVTAGSFNNVRAIIRNDAEATKDKLKSIGWNAIWKLGDGWSITGDLTHSEAERDQVIIETTAGTAQSALRTAQYDTFSFTNNPNGFRTGLDYNNRSIIRLTDVQGWGGGVNSPQAGYTKLPHVEDELDAIRVTARKELKGAGLFTAVEAGVNIAERDKTRTFTEGRLVIAGDTTGLGSAAMPGNSSLTVAGLSFATFDPSGAIGSIYEVQRKLHPDIYNKDWTVNEKVNTFFVRGELFREAGVPVRGNVGLQIVQADQESTAFSVDRRTCPNDQNCPASTVTLGTDYIDVLPSLNLAFELAPDQIVRFALARVMARPNMNDMRASSGFGLDSQLNVLKGDAGNPLLKPTRANAIDLAWEKYWGNKAYVGAAVFYKDLKTYTLNQEFVVDFAPYITPSTVLPANGMTFGLLKAPINGTGGSLQGLELSASLPFSMLTSALDGFGLQANYSKTSSSVQMAPGAFSTDGISSQEIPLPGLSRDVGNLTLYYEKSGFSARVAARSRSDFIGEITNIVGDRQLTWVEGETITDLQLGYEFGSGYLKGLSIIFQANNINNTHFRRYRDKPSNMIEDTEYGKTYLLGLNYKL